MVLQTGSRAGTQAPIYYGYYMIGRHKECQIRPKSRSVSRHHCLLHHDPHGIKVIDLDSTSGTRLNEERLEPRQWVPITDGDMLRCGKIVFRVSCEKVTQKADQQVHAAVGAAAAGSMVSGEAWQEVDIADYLDSEDDADRERRYESIRDQRIAKKTAADSDELDASDDDFDGASPTVAEGESVANIPDQPVGRRQDESAESGKSAASDRPAPGRLPKKYRRKLSGAKASSTPIFADSERLKLIAAAILTVAMLGYLGYSAYRSYNGPEVRVLEGID